MQVLTINQYTTRSSNMWILECWNAGAHIEWTNVHCSSINAFVLLVLLSLSLFPCTFHPSFLYKIRNKTNAPETHSIIFLFEPRMQFHFPKWRREEENYRKAENKRERWRRRRRNGVDNKEIDALTQLLCKNEQTALQSFPPPIQSYNNYIEPNKTKQKTFQRATCEFRFFIRLRLILKILVQHQTTCGRKFQFQLRVFIVCL